MAKIVNWLKQTIVNVVDPDKEQRIAEASILIHHELARLKEAFHFDTVATQLNLDSRDIEPIREATYKKILETRWKDLEVTTTEKQVLKWVAQRLALPPQRERALNWQRGIDAFGSAFAAAIDDGELDESELRRLEIIAQSVDASLQDIVRRYFVSQGEHFLRGYFYTLIEDGRLTSDEWDRLLAMLQKLGLSKAEFLQSIGNVTRQFVEHILAEAKADGVISQSEEDYLEWLILQFSVSTDFARYVRTQVEDLKLLSQIAAGKLPSVDVARAVELRSGEIAHYHGPAQVHRIKILKSGQRVEHHKGNATITDHRIIFDSATSPLNVLLRKVLSVKYYGDGIHVSTSGKGAGQYYFSNREHIVFEIMRVAIGRANQTIVERVDGLPTRHIPRDVRQRVWQKYGARCADCSAEDYLEFDHIIPVAKGGSNTDANVQLLCRRCNSKKSDAI